MTLSERRQSVFPLEWCKRVGLATGGPVNVFDLGENGLLIRPLRQPTAKEIAKLLEQAPAGGHSAEEAGEVVRRALKKVRRREARRH